MVAGTDGRDDLTVLDHIRLARGDRVERIAPLALFNEVLARRRLHPCSMLQYDGEVLEGQSPERGKTAKLRERLHGGGEVGRLDVVGEQAVERGLVDLEELRVADRSDRGASRRRPEERELAERLARTHRAKDAGVSSLGMLILDGHEASSDQVERVGPVALAEDRVIGRQGPQSDPPRQVGQDVSWQVFEGGERVDHLSCFDPPRSLAPEPYALGEAPSTFHECTNEDDRAADEGSGEEESKHQQQESGSQPPVPQVGDDATEDVLPEEIGGPEGEDGEGKPDRPVKGESEFLPSEPFPSSEFVPQIALDERERAKREVANLNQIGKDPVAVELEQWDQVEKDDVVVQQREAVEETTDRRFGEREHEERRGSGQREFREGTTERLQHPLSASQHQSVRRIDEEGGRAEEDEEARRDHLPPVVLQHRSVPQLVEEGQDQPQGKEQDGLRGCFVDGEGEALRRDRRHEGGQAAHREEREHGRAEWPEGEPQAPPVAEVDERIRSVPADPEG